MIEFGLETILRNFCHGRFDFLNYNIKPLLQKKIKTISNCPHPPHKHSCIEFVQTLQGTCKMSSPKESKKLDTNNVCVILPNTLHAQTYYKINKPYIIIAGVVFIKSIHFYIGKYCQQGDKYAFLPDIEKASFPLEGFEEISFIQKEENFEGNSSARIKFQGLILLLLYHCLKKLKAEGAYKQIQTEDKIEKVIEYIEHYHNNEITVQELASMVRLAPNHLNTVFRKKTGKPIHQYITDLRLKHACGLFEDGDLIVKEVAYKTGFKDPLYFSRLFKKQVGVSPSEYLLKQKALLKNLNK